MSRVLSALGAAALIGALIVPAMSPAQSADPMGITDAKLLGQRIMVGLPGSTATPALLRAVRRGEVGAVILFAYNIANRRQVVTLTGLLQRAARQGANPPLLIAVDQEGGQVKRFGHGPPFLSPPQMGGRGSAATGFGQGAMTGRFLKARGINMDLAPVLDVPTSSRSFIWQQGRAFSFSASTVARVAGAFALGLQSTGVAATGKHFPGIGSAGIDTDNARQELRPTRLQRTQALVPYQSLIPRGLDAVMLSTAGFPAYDRSGASAALSASVISGLLRRKLGFRGVTITDSLSSPTGHDEVSGGVIAAAVGADVLLYGDSAPGELEALEHTLRVGRISRASALASYNRILALKNAVAR